MPSLGASEIILILLIAFIVVGPKDLPKIARALARLVKRIRIMFGEIKEEMGVNEIESEVKNVRREVEQTVKSVDVRADLNEARNEIDKTLKDTRKELNREITDTREKLARIGRETKNDIIDEAVQQNNKEAEE